MHLLAWHLLVTSILVAVFLAVVCVQHVLALLQRALHAMRLQTARRVSLGKQPAKSF